MPSNPAFASSRAIVAFLEGSGDAADPQLDAAPDGGRHLAAHDDVRYGEPPAGLEHAKCLGEHAILVRRQVDHAVRDDHVHGVVGERDRLDLALQELDVVDTRLALILARQREHLVRHVQAVRLAGRSDAPGRQQHVDAAAGAEIQDRLTRRQLGERRRIPAAERGGDGLFRQLSGLILSVQVRRDRVAAAPGRGAATARRRLARDHPQRGLSVLLLHAVLDALVAHPASPRIKKS